MIVHLSIDLMLVAKVSSSARQQGAAYRSSAKPGDALSHAPSARTILVDLQLPALDIAEFADQVRNASPEAKLVGYAQHVMTDLIRQATEARFDAVLTRGQFDRNFKQFF